MAPCWPRPPKHGCEGGAESTCESNDPEEVGLKRESPVKPLTPPALKENGLFQTGRWAVSKETHGAASADWLKVLKGGGSVWALPNRRARYWAMWSQEVQSELCKNWGWGQQNCVEGEVQVIPRWFHKTSREHIVLYLPKIIHAYKCIYTFISMS